MMARRGTAVLLACACLLQSSMAFTPSGLFSSVAKGTDGKISGREARASLCSLHMGKGKSKVPITQRGEMKKRQEMQRMRDEMMGDDTDGMPVFNVFTRSKKAQVWYPCGSLKGDARSKSLVEAWRDNSLFLKDQYKTTLDKGMAKSIFEQREKFVDSVVKLYPQLKQNRVDLEFGYKVKIPGLEEAMAAEGREEELKTTILSEDMAGGGFLDNLFGGK